MSYAAPQSASGVHNGTDGYGVLGYRRRMSVSIVSAIEEAHAQSWREWQVKNEDGERQIARRARVVFTLIFIALGVWFGLQLVS